MKSVYIAALIGASIMSVVNAQCACAPTDSACLNKCGKIYNFFFQYYNSNISIYIVTDANTCVSNCRTDACYSSCVSNHWPGVDPAYTVRPPVEAPTSAAAPTSVAKPTSAAASQSAVMSESAKPSGSSVASQSSAWSSTESMPTSSWSSAVSQSSSFSSVSPTGSSSAWSQVSSSAWSTSSAWSASSTWSASRKFLFFLKKNACIQ